MPVPHFGIEGTGIASSLPTILGERKRDMEEKLTRLIEKMKFEID